MEDTKSNTLPAETPRPRFLGRVVRWSMNRKALARTAAFFAAAIGFWLPSIVIHFIFGPRYGVVGVLLTTIACPAAAAIVFTALSFFDWDYSLARRAFWFLLGVWMWGPPSMLVSASFSSGGPHMLTEAGECLVMWALFVVTTPMMATYDGSLVALLVATLALGVVMIKGRNT